MNAEALTAAQIGDILRCLSPVASGSRLNLRERSPMSEGRARLRAVERGQVGAYPLGTGLPHMQPGADRAHRRHAPGRKLDREYLRSPHLERIGIRHALRLPAGPCRFPTAGQSG